MFETPEFWVRSKAKSLSVATDGEVNRMTTPLHYLSRPGALCVIVPQGDKAVPRPAKSD